MAHNFHRHLQPAYANNAGFSFVSKAGSDNNGFGAGPDSPMASITAAVQAGINTNAYQTPTIIVGAGTYTGSPGYPNYCKLVADGFVTWNVNGELNWPRQFTQGPQQYIVVDGFTLNNVTVLTSETYTAGSYAIFPVHFVNCTLNLAGNAAPNIVGAQARPNDSPTWADCIIRNINESGAHPIQFVRCLLFGANTYALGLSNCYVDSASAITLPSAQAINYCNVQGTLRVAGDSFGFTDLATFKQNYNLQARADLVNVAPNFNKAAAGDYTLKLSSAHLDLGIGPASLRYALAYYVEFDGAPGDLCTTGNSRLRSTTGAVVQFLEIGGFTVNEQGGLVIAANSSGNFEGYYTTDRLRVAAVSQPIDFLPVIFAGNYDSDYPTSENAFSSTIPEPRNNNVPCRNNFTSGQAGRNPHRLTVQARFSPNLNPDITQSGDWVGGTYYDFEIGQKPTYNAATGLGNGHPSYDLTPASVTQVEARWLQFRYRARNNYFSR